MRSKINEFLRITKTVVDGKRAQGFSTPRMKRSIFPIASRASLKDFLIVILELFFFAKVAKTFASPTFLETS